MKRFLASLLFLAAFIAGAQAQIVQFSGAPIGNPPQYLVQQFTTAPVALWGTQKQNSTYAGASFQVRCPAAATLQDIGFTGQEASAAALTSFLTTSCSGASTGLLAKVYDQIGSCDLVQATSGSMQTVLVDTDGKVSFRGASGKSISTTCTALKTAKVHTFGVFYPGYVQDTTGGPVYALWSYGTTDITGERYGIGLWPYSNVEVWMPRNASTAGNLDTIYTYGNAHLGGTSGFHVWDLLTNTGTLRHDTVPLTPGLATADVTYPTTDTFTVGNDGAGEFYPGKWRMVVPYGNVRADRDSISNFLISAYAITLLPTSVTTPDGFTWQPQLVPTYNFSAADIWGISWNKQTGAYPWSLYFPTNLSSPSITTLTRFEVRPGDDATLQGIDGTERSEQATNTAVVPGQDFAFAVQFMVEAGPTQTGSWADILQFLHYGTGEVNGSPDLVYISILNNLIQFITTKDGGQTNQGSPIALVRGTWYAVVISAHTSTNHTSDTLDIWFGTNGSTLNHIVSIGSSAIWNSNTWDAYVKNGIYRGFPHENSGTLAIQVANYQFSNTLNAFSAQVTTQKTLPSHPFLLKRDMSGAANDNDITPMFLNKAA